MGSVGTEPGRQHDAGREEDRAERDARIEERKPENPRPIDPRAEDVVVGELHIEEELAADEHRREHADGAECAQIGAQDQVIEGCTELLDRAGQDGVVEEVAHGIAGVVGQTERRGEGEAEHQQGNDGHGGPVRQHRCPHVQAVADGLVHEHNQHVHGIDEQAPACVMGGSQTPSRSVFVQST